MKKMNKKGFTLIELLAVIIILGILMIIAIPSVTTYIQNSRKSAYVDSASAYIDAVRTKVNEGKDLKFFATNTMYLVPVGHESGKTCVSTESGGKSPFSDSWNYAYVGVVYNGSGYSYYFIGEDGAKQGLGLIDQNALSKDGNDNLYSSYSDTSASGKSITSDVAGLLKTEYDNGAKDTGANVTYYKTPDTSEGSTQQAYPTGVEDAVTKGVTGITKTVFVAAKSCTY